MLQLLHLLLPLLPLRPLPRGTLLQLRRRTGDAVAVGHRERTRPGPARGRGLPPAADRRWPAARSYPCRSLGIGIHHSSTSRGAAAVVAGLLLLLVPVMRVPAASLFVVCVPHPTTRRRRFEVSRVRPLPIGGLGEAPQVPPPDWAAAEPSSSSRLLLLLLTVRRRLHLHRHEPVAVLDHPPQTADLLHHLNERMNE
eukprot:GHVU01190338.1.p1 GENE.GHVU01190338.1~~GHVU01190338.1.p1  ORF type:complete len:197 (-),score=23.96 GHVU01190338.1:96-686(-)